MELMTEPAPAETATPLLTARDLWFTYASGKEAALKGVDFEVPAGRMTMVLGRSGSGKTTLLRALKGLVTPQKGSVSFTGNGRAGFHRAVAYVPQNLGLVRGLTALENVLAGSLSRMGLWRTLFHAFHREDVLRAKALLEEMGLARLADQKVGRLSGGERQRVAIARALMLKPHLVLADEFVSQLDALTTREILDRMKALKDRGVTFLITTHEPEIVSRYAERLVIMRRGKVAFSSENPGSLSETQILELLR